MRPAYLFAVILSLPAAPLFAADAQKSTACPTDPRCHEYVETLDQDNRAGLDIFPLPSNAGSQCLHYDGNFVSFVQPDGSLRLTCVAPRWP